MQDMSKFLQLAVMEDQFREAKASKEEVFFDRFAKAKVSKPLLKSKTPYVISEELSLELSCLHQIRRKSPKYSWENFIAHLITLLRHLKLII